MIFMMHGENWQIRRLWAALCVISTSKCKTFLLALFSRLPFFLPFSIFPHSAAQPKGVGRYFYFPKHVFQGITDLFLACGVGFAKWMFNFIFNPQSNVKRINKKLKKACTDGDVYLFVVDDNGRCAAVSAHLQLFHVQRSEFHFNYLPPEALFYGFGFFSSPRYILPPPI